jgi:hypothetical protein
VVLLIFLVLLLLTPLQLRFKTQNQLRYFAVGRQPNLLVFAAAGGRKCARGQGGQKNAQNAQNLENVLI